MAAAQATIEIEPIRTRYRNQIQQAILTTVLSKKNKKESSQLIAKFAKEHIPVADQNRFIEIVEIELACLHEGNFARFKIRLKDFFTWKDCWK